MRNRAAPKRSMRAGTKGQSRASASCAGPAAVMAGRPKKSTSMPSFIFWSARTPRVPPLRSRAIACFAPSAPLGMRAPPATPRRRSITGRTKGLFGRRAIPTRSTPSRQATIGRTSQFARWPETRMPGRTRSCTLGGAPRSITSTRSAAGAVMRPRCGYSAALRPRLSHMPRTTASISGPGLSGKARRRLARAQRVTGRYGPSVRPSQPPRFEAVSTGSSRNSPKPRSRPSASSG